MVNKFDLEHIEAGNFASNGVDGPIPMIDPQYVAHLNLQAYHAEVERRQSAEGNASFWKAIVDRVDLSLERAGIEMRNTAEERIDLLAEERDQLRALLVNIREYVSDPRCSGDDYRISRMIDNSGLVD